MSTVYITVKSVHVGCALLSIAGFVVRGLMLLMGLDLPRKQWVRRLSYIVDSVLLVTAVAMMMLLGQYPFISPWLAAKVIGVSTYIGGGIASFRLLSAGHRVGAIGAGVVSLLAACYVVSVAVTKKPFAIPLGAFP